MSLQDDYYDLSEMLNSERCPHDEIYKDMLERIWDAFWKEKRESNNHANLIRDTIESIEKQLEDANNRMKAITRAA